MPRLAQLASLEVAIDSLRSDVLNLILNLSSLNGSLSTYFTHKSRLADCQTKDSSAMMQVGSRNMLGYELGPILDMVREETEELGSSID